MPMGGMGSQLMMQHQQQQMGGGYGGGYYGGQPGVNGGFMPGGSSAGVGTTSRSQRRRSMSGERRSRGGTRTNGRARRVGRMTLRGRAPGRGRARDHGRARAWTIRARLEWAGCCRGGRGGGPRRNRAWSTTTTTAPARRWSRRTRSRRLCSGGACPGWMVTLALWAGTMRGGRTAAAPVAEDERKRPLRHRLEAVDGALGGGKAATRAARRQRSEHSARRSMPARGSHCLRWTQ